MKKKYLYRSISIIVPLIMALSILIPSSISLYYLNRLNNDRIRESAEDTIYTGLYGTALLVENLMEDVEKFAKELSSDERLDQLADAFGSKTASPDTRSKISLILSESIGDLRSLETICLFGSQWDTIISTDLFSKEFVADDGASGSRLTACFRNHEGEIAWFNADIGEDTAGRMCFIRPLETQNNCSALFVLKNEYVSENIQIPYAGSNFYMTDYDGNVLYGQDWEKQPVRSIQKKEDFRNIFNIRTGTGSFLNGDGDEQMLILYYNSVGSGWKYINATPTTAIFESGSGGIRYQQYIILLFSLTGLIIGSLLLNLMVGRPLRKLNAHMIKVEEGSLEPLEERYFAIETRSLFEGFNHMIRELKRMINEVYVQQLLRKQAELKSLHAQIDEHFLYNTLNSIYCVASGEGARAASDMLIDLSRYFRTSLSKGKDKVGLMVIAEMITSYLNIQRGRYGERLSCALEGFPDMAEYRSLKYIYQPIVENAIVHGFETEGGVHHLRISFAKEGDLLCFSVSDDGKGMTRERLAEVMEQSRPFAEETHGFAIKNIREQIALTYGEQYDIEIQSEEGVGTTVSIRIPLERNDEHE